MALKQLTPEQIRDWTIEQKDRWWLENVYKGDMPQLTLRSGLTGFMLGGVLSATNLYVGAKTGWTLGVGITSVILAFAMYKAMARVGLGREFTLLENNCMQSIATAAGYMTAPLISSLGAYMLITGEIIPWWMIMPWIICLSLLGVLCAFPMKRRFINDEQHPFPEGRACGVVLDALHTSDASVGVFKARALLYTALGAGAIRFLQGHGIQEAIQVRLLGLKEVVWSFPEMLDGWIYRLAERFDLPVPGINGVPLRELTMRPELDIAMIGAGGLMGIRAGTSLLIGALITYGVLAPAMIQAGDIRGVVNDAGALTFGFRNITEWALWGGVSLMVTSSLVAFLGKPQIIISAFRGLFGHREPKSDALKHIELPTWVFIVGIPLVGAAAVIMANVFFGVEYWHGAVAIPLVFVLCLIGANSTALTGTTPTGAIGKVTQLTYGVIAPGNIRTNIMSAGIAAEAASNAANLLMDIKPGYMLGAKPRQQAIGHCIGIIAGALAAVPLFQFMFLSKGDTTAERLSNLQSDAYPMPAVSIWKSVAEILTEGIDKLPTTAVYAAAIGAALGVILETIKIASKNRVPIVPVAIGLATVIPFNTCFAMFMGSFIFWVLSLRYKNPESRGYRVFVDNQEPICAGLIAGAALIGIADILVGVFILG